MLQTLCWFLFWARIPSTNKIVATISSAGAIYRVLEYIIWFLWMVSRVKTYRNMDNKNHHTNILSPFPSPELRAVLPAMFVNFRNMCSTITLKYLSKMYGSWLHGFFPRTGPRDSPNSHMTGIPWLFVIQVFSSLHFWLMSQPSSMAQGVLQLMSSDRIEKRANKSI